MAMGTRRARQAVLLVAADELPNEPSVQFYVGLHAIPAKNAGFDEFVENLCRRSTRPYRAAPCGPRVCTYGCTCRATC